MRLMYGTASEHKPADEACFSLDLRLIAGQVITIEPGVYVPEDKRYPKEFRGLGIRIEVSVRHYLRLFLQ
jgi:hypothetical protein